jgi:ribosomal protein L16 Arg81 hydroxylase
MSLKELISPIEPDIFFSEYWETQPIAMRHEASRFAQVFSSSEMGRLLEFRPPRAPEGMLLVKNSRHCDVNWIHPDGTPRIDKVRGAFLDGYTIVVNKLEKHWEPVALLAASLEEDLHHPINVNLYYTPPGTQGFEPHFDVMDTFILQLEGSKVWEVREAGAHLPLPDDHAPLAKDRLPALLFEEEMKAGTVLYLPRGFVHSARTNDAASLHLTIGINVVTWIDLFSAALVAARRDVRFKQALPPGFFTGPDGMRERFASMLGDLKQTLSFDDAMAALAERCIVPKRPPGEQLLPDDTEFRPDTVLSRRDGLICRASAGAGYAAIHYSGGRIVGPAKIAPALRHVEANRSFPIASLPGELNEKEKFVLARRLVKEGLLCVGGKR